MTPDRNAQTVIPPTSVVRTLAATGRKIRIRSWITLAFGVLAIWPCLSVAAPNVAFFYGVNPPIDELRAFDVVVLDPEHVPIPPNSGKPRTEWLAYVSAGEVQGNLSYFAKVPRVWLRQQNPRWGSWVIDQSQAGWQQFLIEQVLAPLWKAGYRGFFLDNLDSYSLIATTPEDRDRQVRELTQLLLKIAQSFPDAKLILNRGFELLPAVHQHVFAVAAESLYQTWDPIRDIYVSVPVSERNWLLPRLRTARDEYKLPVIVIDYAAPSERAQARAIAKKISALHFVPWVTNGALNALGLGNVEVMPRKVLMLYDSTQYSLQVHPIHRLIAMPLNYLGYVPEYVDVGRALPEPPLAGRYAGIVAWFDSDRIPNFRAVHEWLVRQIHAGMRVAFLGTFGFPLSESSLQPFGLRLNNIVAPVAHVDIVRQLPGIGFESAALPDPSAFVPVQVNGLQADVLLQLKATSGAVEDAVALTAWGGYGLQPFAVAQLPNGALRWIVNPFDFLARALALVPTPIPDVTTENGRRLFMVHVDGDGAASRANLAGAPFSGEILLREILQRYRVPTTVSVITGEIAPHGLYPASSKELSDIARRIFALPYVEIASHSYSHPSDWQKIRAHPDSPGYNLPIPGYHYNVDTEIPGSVEYIDAHLAPDGKKARLFLWSGACNPEAKALALTYGLGLGNMNGGDTLITNANRTLTAVAPLGLERGGYFQVYAPNQNENVYTNGWTGPFYGYRRVVETFKLTDAPRRLKPIDIYYHFFSLTRKASIVALKEVYDWALRQSVFPVFASEYVRKAMDFNHVVVARVGDHWLIRNLGSIRELRIPNSLGYPDLARSHGIIGFNTHEEARYIHTTGGEDIELRLQGTPSIATYLVEANGQVVEWQRQPGELRFRLLSHVPLRFSLARAESCVVISNGTRLRPTAMRDDIRRFDVTHGHEATISCRTGA